LLLQFDYKQIELLVMLYVAREWELLGRCINDGLDFHSMTAADFYNKSYETIDKTRRDLRRAIKPISLGRIFGKGVESTARDMEMSEKAVSEIFSRYDKIIPGLSRFQTEEVDRVERKGYVHTEFGWRRWFTNEEQKYVNRNSNATEIFNTRIQSNAGLRTRQALVEIWRALKSEYGEGVGSKARIILTVHDSGLFSVHPDATRRVAEIVTEIATGPTHALPARQLGMSAGLQFPIDLEVGENWGDMRPWEEYISGDLSLEPQSLINPS
jgi:DNA polymerase I-like protein with 3'-5' exonuclease and polymerase domains